jgi:hypothetical protein
LYLRQGIEREAEGMGIIEETGGVGKLRGMGSGVEGMGYKGKRGLGIGKGGKWKGSEGNGGREEKRREEKRKRKREGEVGERWRRREWGKGIAMVTFGVF